MGDQGFSGSRRVAIHTTHILRPFGSWARTAVSIKAALCILLPALIGSRALDAAPANDDFNSSIILSASLPVSGSGTNVDATAEVDEPDHDGHSPSTSVWWEWTPVADVHVQIDTFGSSFDTLLAVYTWDEVFGFSSVASNDGSAGGNQSRVAFQAIAGTTYRIAVDGNSGEEGSISLQLGYPEPPPVLDSLTMAPGLVDVEFDSQFVLIEVEATDELSGVAQVYVNFHDTFNAYRGGANLSFDNIEGTWVGMLTVPIYSVPGTWRATVGLSDFSGATSSYGPHGDNPLPLGSATEIVVENEGESDTEPPEVTAVSFSHTSVNVTHAPQQVQVEIDLVDLPSGVQHLFLDLYDSEGERVEMDTHVQQIEGDTNGGKWRITISIPRFTAPDVWDVYFNIADVTGNWVYLGAPFPGEPDGQIEVLNSGPVDTEDPELLTLTITPDQVDVDSGPKDVTLVATLSDDAAGIDEVYASFYNDADENIGYVYLNRTPDGTLTEGTWAAVLTVPSFIPSGTWHTRISMRDRAGKFVEYSDVFSWDLPMPLDAEDTFEVSFSGVVDVLHPELTGFSMSEETVNVTDGAAQVTITAEVSDDVAGVREVYVNFYNADEEYLGGTTLVLDTGVPISGEWVGVYTVPRYAVPEIRYAQVSLSDFAGKYSGYSNLFSYNQDLPGGESGELLVVNTGTVDADPPQLISFAVTPSSVEVWNHSEDLTVTVDLTDDGLGVDQVWVEFYTDAGDYLGSSELSVFSGIPTNGRWQGGFTVDEGTPPGLLHARINTKDLTDKYGSYSNYFSYDTDLPNGESGVVEVVAPPDIEAPQLLSFSISPDTVDVSPGEEEYATITIEASDDLSGVQDVYVEFFDGASNQVGSAGFHLDEGIVTGGTWVGTLTVFPFTAQGTWHARVYLTDGFGNESAHGNLFPADEDLPNSASGELAVVNSGDTDEIGPVLAVFSITPDSVDTGSGDQMVLLSVEATDEPAGIRNCYVNFYNEFNAYTGGLTLALEPGGSRYDGTWEAELMVPQYLAQQSRFAQVVLVDYANNYSQYSSVFNGDQDLPGGASGELEITNSGVSDTAPPVLTSIQFTPGAVRAGESVGLTITATDATSGVEYARIDFYNSYGFYQFSTELNLDSGPSTNGTWIGTAYIPETAVLGAWDSVVVLQDRVGLSSSYGPSQSGLPFPGSATGQLAIIGEPTETLASFADDYMLEGLNAEYDANTDGDTAILLFEYAFHLDPTLHDAKVMTPDIGDHGLPWVGFRDLGGGTKVLEVQFVRRLNSTDLTYVVEFGSDLSAAGPGSWEAASNPESTEYIDTEWERVIVQDSETTTTENTRFGRVSVTADAP